MTLRNSFFFRKVKKKSDCKGYGCARGVTSHVPPQQAAQGTAQPTAEQSSRVDRSLMMTRAVGLRPAAKPRPFDAKTKPALPSIPRNDGETSFCAQSEMFCGGYKRHDSRPAIHPDSTHKITESLSSSESLVSCLVQALPEARALELTHAISWDLATFCYLHF